MEEIKIRMALELEQRRADLEYALLWLSDTMRPLDDRIALEGRLKSARSIWLKMQRSGLRFEDIHDLVGTRILVDSVEQCYGALETLEAYAPCHCTTHRDYIAAPKPNGYQSLHVWVTAPRRPAFEVQIRTREMHEASVRGRAAHWQYKLSTLRAVVEMATRRHPLPNYRFLQMPTSRYLDGH
jgi:(p)ppGpp synthase/HD superfamily hydrolase